MIISRELRENRFKKNVRLHFLYFVTPLFLIVTACSNTQNYPKTKKTSDKEIIFNNTIKDPYRWLENIEDKKVINWIGRQQKFTNNYFKKIIKPILLNEYKDLENNSNYPKSENDSLYVYCDNYFSNDLKSEYIYSVNKFTNKKKLITKVNDLLHNNESLLTNQLSLSPNGRYLTICIDLGYDDLAKIRIFDIPNNEFLKYTIKASASNSIGWINNGFYYCSYENIFLGMDNDLKNQSIYFHRIGTPPSTDIFTYQNTQSPDSYYYLKVLGKYLLIEEYNKSVKNNLLIKSIFTNQEVRELTHNERQTCIPIDVRGNLLYCHTNLNSRNYNLVSIDLSSLVLTECNDIIQNVTNPIMEISTCKNYIIANFCKNGNSTLKIFDFKGILIDSIRENIYSNIKINFTSTRNNTIYYTTQSFTNKPCLNKYNIDTKKNIRITKENSNTEKYITKLVEYISYDNTRIKMQIVYNTNTKINRETPIIIKTAGSFEEINSPIYSANTHYWLKNGGIIATPFIRGGFEQGDTWHLAGKGIYKINSINDILYAIKYLHKNNYSSPNYSILTSEKGGTYPAATAINREPELVKIAIFKNGFFDLVRYDKLGWGYSFTDEFGNIDNKNQSDFLQNNSPIHNVNNAKDYPATLIITQENNIFSHPSHSYKYIATLQQKNKDHNTKLLFVENHNNTNIKLASNLNSEEIFLNFIYKNLEKHPSNQ